MPELTFQAASRVLRSAITAGVPTFISGPPGIGKSTMVRSVASELGLPLRDVRVALLDAVDLRGLPFPDSANGRTKWLPPEFLPAKGSTDSGILFLDEINAAPPGVQAACYQLVLDRRIGEYELPDGWAICAAGNRVSDKTVVYSMPSALRNRFLTIELRADLQEWLDWAKAMAGGSSQCHSLITDFLSFRPSLLIDLPESLRDSPFPTPRSWTLLSRLLRAAETAWTEFPPTLAHSGERELLRSMLEGTVGHAAADFMSFIDSTADREFVKQFLADPTGSDVPRDPPRRMVLISALAERVRSDMDGARMAAKCLMRRLPDKEWREKLRSDVIKRCPEMLREPEFREDVLR